MYKRINSSLKTEALFFTAALVCLIALVFTGTVFAQDEKKPQISKIVPSKVLRVDGRIINKTVLITGKHLNPDPSVTLDGDIATAEAVNSYLVVTDISTVKTSVG